jgi:hypothetical protein
VILEALTPHAELKSVGRARFAGSTSTKNYLWFHYRNYLRQAMANFRVALSVPNRSSSLLYYYAMLNFAKAELIDTHSQAIVGRRIGHGLSFDPTRANTVSGDSLIVREGVFPLLYERRTGHKIPLNTRLPVKRLLSAIPEIGQQFQMSGMGVSFATGLDMMTAHNGTKSWILMRVDPTPAVLEKSTARTLLMKHFRFVRPPAGWKDAFAVSRRHARPVAFLESKVTVPLTSTGDFDSTKLHRIVDEIRDLIHIDVSEDCDAFLSPYLYKTTKLAMPPALARYAVTYYASSLVRYRPSAFDAEKFPEQAFLFDAIARECATPMLADTFTALHRAQVVFQPTGSLRV